MGGAERVMITLANRFEECGNETHLVLSEPKGELLEELVPTVRLVNLGSGRMIRTLFPLMRYLRIERPDSLLATLSFSNFVAILARKWAGAPTRVVIREASTPKQRYSQSHSLKNRLSLRLMSWLYPQADTVVAVSRGVADDLKNLGVPNPIVVYNPALTKQFARLREEPIDHPWFQRGEPPVILGVGRLEPVKDFATLLRAFALIIQQLPARLVILGEGGERASLEHLAQSLGIAEQVHMPGFVSNPFPYMRRAGVFVLSSRFEGLPNSLIQAMACKCPVVSTDCPSGPNEILSNGEYGHLVPVGDSLALAEAILEVLQGGGKPVPPEWLNQFEEEVIVERYLNLLSGNRFL